MNIVRCRQFNPSDQAKLQDFRCCAKEPPEDFESEISDWIKDIPPGIIAHDLSEGNVNSIYVYIIGEADRERIIAYAALGAEEWELEAGGKRGAKATVSMIAMLGLRSEFHGQSIGGEGTQRYSSVIFQDVLDRAAERCGPGRAVGLYVHEDNNKARRLYENNGFKRLNNIEWINPKLPNKRYHGMVLYVPDKE